MGEKFEIVPPALEELAADPRQMLREMGDLALSCFRQANEDFTCAEHLNVFIRGVQAPKNLLATDMADMESKSGGERVRRLRDLYATRNQVLVNARRAAREGVFIMRQAAEAAEFVKRIVIAAEVQKEPTLDPATAAIVNTAAARMARLGNRRAFRESKALRTREADIVGAMPVDEPPDEGDDVAAA